MFTPLLFYVFFFFYRKGYVLSGEIALKITIIIIIIIIINMFRSNVNSKFLYFVGKVFDENTGKVCTRLNGWQYSRWMSIRECINYLVQFFTGRCQCYSFSVKFTFS